MGCYDKGGLWVQTLGGVDCKHKWVLFDGNILRLSIEGFVGRRESQRINISGVQISVTAATAVRGREGNQLFPNDRVTVDAVIEDRNAVATRIDARNPESHDARELRPEEIRGRTMVVR